MRPTYLFKSLLVKKSKRPMSKLTHYCPKNRKKSMKSIIFVEKNKKGY